jgi:hypothetical protein
MDDIIIQEVEMIANIHRNVNIHTAGNISKQHFSRLPGTGI